MQQNRRRRMPWTIVLLILVLCCAAAYGGATLLHRVRGSSAIADTRTLQLSSIQKLETVGDGFVYYDGDTLTKIASDGDRCWNYMVGSNMSFSATDEGIATWTGSKLTLINSASGMADYSGTMDGEILSACVGSEYAAVLIGPEHNSTIVLMETGGRKVDSITLSDQTVVDYGFFYNDTLFWIMTLDTNGTSPTCTVSTYRPGRRMVGSISDTEQLLYSAAFQSTQIVVTGELYQKVYTYNGTEETDARRLVYGYTLASVDEDSDNPMMAFVPNDQYDATVGMRDVKLIRGSDERIVRMPFECMSLIARADRVYGFSTQGYVMVARLDRQKVDAYQLPIDFDQVYGVTDDSVAVLGNGDVIYLVSLK